MFTNRTQKTYLGRDRRSRVIPTVIEEHEPYAKTVAMGETQQLLRLTLHASMYLTHRTASVREMWSTQQRLESGRHSGASIISLSLYTGQGHRTNACVNEKVVGTHKWCSLPRARNSFVDAATTQDGYGWALKGGGLSVGYGMVCVRLWKGDRVNENTIRHSWPGLCTIRHNWPGLCTFRHSWPGLCTQPSGTRTPSGIVGQGNAPSGIVGQGSAPSGIVGQGSARTVCRNFAGSAS